MIITQVSNPNVKGNDRPRIGECKIVLHRFRYCHKLTEGVERCRHERGSSGSDPFCMKALT